MTVYINSIDIEDRGSVEVSGFSSATNISVDLVARVYVQPPADGIWEFDVAKTVTGPVGGTMLTPFTASAPFSEAARAKGVRIHLPDGSALTRLKVEKVENFSTSAHNQIMVQSASVSKGTLVIDVKYGGGCFEHDFSLEWDGLTLESDPPQYQLVLADKSPFDPCKAIVHRQLRFDITTSDVQFAVPSFLLIGTPEVRDRVTVPLGLSTVVECKKDEPTEIVGGLKLTLKDVSDSRCPVNAVCVWPGFATATLEWEQGSESGEAVLSTDHPGPVALGTTGYRVGLLSVAPYPGTVGETLVAVRVTTT